MKSRLVSAGQFVAFLPCERRWFTISNDSTNDCASLDLTFRKGLFVPEQWEYKLLVGHGIHNTLRDQNDEEHGQLSEELLDKLGKEGWEFCSHTVLPATLILKRKLKSA